MNREMIYSFLNCLTGFSIGNLRKMVEEAKDAEAFFSLKPEELFHFSVPVTFSQVDQFRKAKEESALEKMWEYMGQKGISYVSEENEYYPVRLFDLPDRPFGLFYRGRLPEENRKAVSVIGSRRCTTYGKEMAHFFASELAKAGVSVISGMAIGVDGYAGRGAFSVSRESFGVLGGGCDVCYPMENMDLYRHLLSEGGVLSERPPQYVGRPYDFPIRNRLISGLSDCLLVIEAAENSGSLLTVNDALNQNREVFALPGRVGDRMSKGCNALLKSGAQVLTCPEDVLQYLGMGVQQDKTVKGKVFLTKEEQVVFQEIGSSPLSVEELLLRTHLPLSVLLELLIQLEVKGLIRKNGISGYQLTY